MTQSSGLQKILERADEGLKSFPVKVYRAKPKTLTKSLRDFAFVREKMASGNLRVEINKKQISLATVLNRSLLSLAGLIPIIQEEGLGKKHINKLASIREDLQRVRDRLDVAAKDQKTKPSRKQASFAELEQDSGAFAPWREKREKQLFERGLRSIEDMMDKYGGLEGKLPQEITSEAGFEIINAPIYCTFKGPLDISRWKNAGIEVEAVYPGYVLDDQTLIAVPRGLSGLQRRKLLLAAISLIKERTKGQLYSNMLSETPSGVITARGNPLDYIWIFPIDTLTEIGRVVVKEATFPYSVPQSDLMRDRVTLERLKGIMPDSELVKIMERKVNPDLRSMRAEMDAKVARKGRKVLEALATTRLKLIASEKRLAELDPKYKERKNVERDIRRAGAKPPASLLNWQRDNALSPKQIARIEKVEERIKERKSYIRLLNKQMDDIRARVAQEFRRKKLGHK